MLINHSCMVLSFTEPAKSLSSSCLTTLGVEQIKLRKSLILLQGSTTSSGLLLVVLLATGLLLGLSGLWWMVLGNLHAWLMAGVCSW